MCSIYSGQLSLKGRMGFELFRRKCILVVLGEREGRNNS